MDCTTCKYCKRLKKDYKVGKGFTESKCCAMLLYIDEIEKDKYKQRTEPWVQEVEENSYCEMYQEAENG